MSRSQPPASQRHGAHPLLDPGDPFPLLTDRQRRIVVRRIHLEAHLELLAPPTWIMRRLGIPFACHLEGMAHPGPDVASYEWNADERERDWSAYRELARVRLRTLRLAHNPSDIKLLAYDLAVPEEIAARGIDYLIGKQQHCPVSVLRWVLEARDLSVHRQKV